MELKIYIPALLIGLLLDRLFGDPAAMPHPVVGFGKAIARGEKLFNRGAGVFVKGMVMTVVLVSVTALFFHGLMQVAVHVHDILGMVVASLMVFYGLAGTTLIREGKAVFAQLEKGLDEGRQQVGRIVGRDTSELSAHEVRTATLETLAENLNDGVVSPLFWFAVAGVPGMMVSKMVNTLDSMIGYQSDRYRHFGRFAARLDDVVQFIPARITALLMVLCSRSKRAWHFMWKYGRAHKSPNAGWPEAALAGILDARFGGSHHYFGTVVEKPCIGKNPRELTSGDLKTTIRILRYVEICMVLLVIIGLLLHP
ncbi:MAG: adenosylcobinamide-phosphate synthase CbiB [Marinilabiliaceae bacterium]